MKKKEYQPQREKEVSEMTKQQQTTAPEAPTVDLLRKRFKMMDEYIESIRKDNLNTGVHSKYLDSLIQWRGDESLERKRVENFIAKATDKKRPGHFWQISDLKARGFVPEEEISEYEHTTYPYRQVNSIHKIKTSDGKFFLRRFETWFALDANGQEIHRSFDFLDFISKPRIEYDRVPVNPQDPDGPTARVKIVRNPINVENDLIKEYITPWSKEKFDEILGYSKNGVIDGRSSTTGPQFVLVHPNHANPVGATYEQMIAPFTDSLFDSIRAPAPEFKDLLNNMKKQAAANVDSYQ
jgi:hypothetical protein